VSNHTKSPPLPGETMSASFPKMMVGESWVAKEFSKKGVIIRNKTIIEIKSDGGFVEEVKDDKGRTLNEYYNNKYQRIVSIDVESGIILTAEKSEGKVDQKNIGMMTDQIVANLVNKFYKSKK